MLNRPPTLANGTGYSRARRRLGDRVEEIYINQYTAEGDNRFRSQQWVHTPLPDGRHLLTLTGIVIPRGPDPKAEPWDTGTTSDQWRSDKVNLIIKFPANFMGFIPPGKSLEVLSAAPFITINTIYNGGEANNAGWGVDDFGIRLNLDRRIRPGVHIWAQLVVRDSDGYLYRLGYSLSLYGQLSDQPASWPWSR